MLGRSVATLAVSEVSSLEVNKELCVPGSSFLDCLMPREAIPFLMWPHVIPTPFPSLLCRQALWSVKSDLGAKHYSIDGKPLPHVEAAVEFFILFFLLYCLLKKPSENVLSRMIECLKNYTHQGGIELFTRFLVGG